MAAAVTATAEAEADGPPVDPKDHITQELEKITNLPAMPTVYNEIEKLSQDSDSTTEQYSNVIEVDPGITTQLLKLCNSSAFSFSRRTSSTISRIRARNRGIQSALQGSPWPGTNQSASMDSSMSRDRNQPPTDAPWKKGGVP